MNAITTMLVERIRNNPWLRWTKMVSKSTHRDAPAARETYEAIDNLCGLVDQQEERIRALETRRNELLALVASISQSTPLPDEAANWTSERAAMIAEIGTLRARVRELETCRRCQRLDAAMLELGREIDGAP